MALFVRLLLFGEDTNSATSGEHRNIAALYTTDGRLTSYRWMITINIWN